MGGFAGRTTRDGALDELNERRAVRRAVRVRCQAVAEDGFRLLGVVGFDVSVGGMLLPSDVAVTVGEPVVVSLLAPGGRSWLDAEARVARIVRGRRTTDAFQGIGLRFERMEAIDRAILAGSLHGFPPPVPARGRRRDYARAVRRIAGALP